MRLFRDERVPVYRKAILVIFQILAGAFAIAYLVFPFDLIFDFLPLPLVGRFDDIVIGALIILLPGAWLFIKSCPEHIVREHVNKISRGE